MAATMPRGLHVSAHTYVSALQMRLGPAHSSRPAFGPQIRGLTRLINAWRGRLPCARKDCRGGSNGGNSRAGRGLAATAAAVAPAAGVSGSMGSPPRVCVLGGGFGGLYTAIKLENLLWQAGSKPKVTIIDQGDRFVFKPLLYELISGTASASEVAPPFTQVLAPYAIQFVQAKVQGVEPKGAQAAAPEPGATGGVVRLADGTSVEYDWLVLALGSSVNTFGIPGVKELAMPFVTYDDAMRLLSRLQDLESLSVPGSGPSVVVVGGGYSGVELAAVLAERLSACGGHVRLVTNEGDVLTRSSEGQRQAARAVLAKRGVSLVRNAKVTSIRQEPGSDKRLVHLEVPSPLPASPPPPAAAADAPSASGGSSSGGGSGGGSGGSSSSGTQTDVLEADIVMWTAGLGPSPRLGSMELPFPANARGQTQVDETLQVLGSEGRVFALGDVAVCAPAPPSGSDDADGPGREQREREHSFPATAQVAFQQADYVAWNVWCSVNGRRLLPFRYQHLGEIMSLGKATAAATLPIELPSELASSISSSPLGPLLTAAGIKLGTGTGAGANGAGSSLSAAGDAGDGKVTLEGPLAQAARRLVYLYRQPTLEQQVRVGTEWAEEGAKFAMGLAGNVLGKQQPKP